MPASICTILSAPSAELMILNSPAGPLISPMILLKPGNPFTADRTGIQSEITMSRALNLKLWRQLNWTGGLVKIPYELRGLDYLTQTAFLARRACTVEAVKGGSVAWPATDLSETKVIDFSGFLC